MNKKILIGSIIIVAFLGTCMFSEKSKEPDGVPSASQTMDKTQKTFSMSLEQFRDGYNKALAEAIAMGDEKNEIRIKDFEITKEKDGQTARHYFTGRHGIRASITNDGKIRHVSVLSSPKDVKDMALFFTHSLGVIGSLNPELPKNKRLDILKRLKIAGANNFNGLNETTTEGNLEYGSTFVEDTKTIIITARPK